jgi:hypothetical protein
VRCEIWIILIVKGNRSLSYGVGLDVGCVVGVEPGVDWVVGVEPGVELAVGVNDGVATTLGTGIAISVGSGVTGKTFVGVLGSVGRAVGVDSLICVLCTVLGLFIMIRVQTSRIRKTTPPPMATWSARR